MRAAAFVASRRGAETDALDALRRWRDEDGDDSVVDLCDDDDDDADDGEIAAYCAAHKWPPEDLVATYLADEPMARRAFRWRRPSVDAPRSRTPSGASTASTRGPRCATSSRASRASST